MKFLRSKPRVEDVPPPVTVFDLVAAEKAFLSQFEIKLTTTGALVYRIGGKFIPLTAEVISKFLRSYLVDNGQVKFWRRDLTDDFAAFVKAGL